VPEGAGQRVRIAVPLDAAGVVPGSIQLSVVRRAPKGESHGVVFLLAGGPGQASAGILSDEDSDSDSLAPFSGYTVVSIDPRGTGGSGALSCDLGGQLPSVAATSCLQKLGAGAPFYSTRANAADLEAVRQALGAPRVIVAGTSYGTVLAQAYARLYPGSVDRLLLDSVAPLTWPDLFEQSSLRAAARILGSTFVTLANGLPEDGIGDHVLDGKGRSRSITVTPAALLDLAFETDVAPGIAAALPGAITAFTHGDDRLLARLVGIADGEVVTFAESPYDVTPAVYLLTTCNDLTATPWAPGTPADQRSAAVLSALRALTPDTLGGFGPWAAADVFSSLCLNWPDRPTQTPLASLPVPDVPVLALSGGSDIRTPVEDAQSVVAAYPRGRLLVVPGVGHDVTDSSPCARRAIATWLADGPVPAACPAQTLRYPLVPVPAKAPPTTRAGLIRAVHATMADAASVLSTSGLFETTKELRFGGLHGGRLRARTSGGILLEDDVFVPGVSVSGNLLRDGLKADGTVRLFGVVHGCGPGKTAFSGTVGDGAAVRLVFPRRPVHPCR
jgi:pimeloyl-ACP methyl ester carboxylesterase